jgi:hypothetical protein
MKVRRNVTPTLKHRDMDSDIPRRVSAIPVVNFRRNLKNLAQDTIVLSPLKEVTFRTLVVIIVVGGGAG